MLRGPSNKICICSSGVFRNAFENDIEMCELWSIEWHGVLRRMVGVCNFCFVLYQLGRARNSTSGIVRLNVHEESKGKHKTSDSKTYLPKLFSGKNRRFSGVIEQEKCHAVAH